MPTHLFYEALCVSRLVVVPWLQPGIALHAFLIMRDVVDTCAYFCLSLLSLSHPLFLTHPYVVCCLRSTRDQNDPKDSCLEPF